MIKAYFLSDLIKVAAKERPWEAIEPMYINPKYITTIRRGSFDEVRKALSIPVDILEIEVAESQWQSLCIIDLALDELAKLVLQ